MVAASKTGVAAAQRLGGAIITHVVGAAQRAAGAISALGGRLKGIAGSAAGAFGSMVSLAGVVTTVFGISAIRNAIAFQESLATINTIARLGVEDTEALGKALRSIAVDRGIRLDDLTTSYYEFLSAGITLGESFRAEVLPPMERIAMAQQTLVSTANLAIGGLATQTEATKLMTFALNAFNLNNAKIHEDTAKRAGVAAENVGEASEVISNYFAKAVEVGVVRASEIASTFATVAATAQIVGIGIDEVAAAYASQTRRGVSAAKVSVSMNRALQDLIQPSKALAALQEKLGVNFEQMAGEKGLGEALQFMRENADRLGISFRDLFKRQEGWRFALNVTGENAKDYDTILKQVRDSANDVLTVNGKVITEAGKGTAAIQAYIRGDTVARNLIKLQEAFRSLGITIGYWFLAPLNKVIKTVTGAIHSVDLFIQGLKGAQLEFARQIAYLTGLVSVIAALGAGLQGFLFVAVRVAPMFGATGTGIRVFQVALSALAVPLALVIGLFGGFAVLVNNNIRGFGQFRPQLEQMQRLFRQLGQVAGDIIGVFTAWWDALSSGEDVAAAVGDAVDNLADSVNMLGVYATEVFSFLGELFVSVAQTILNGLARVIPGIMAWLIDVGKTLIKGLLRITRDIIAWAQDVAPTVIDALGTFAGEVADNVAAAAPSIINALITWTSAFVEWASSVAVVVLEQLGVMLGRVADWFNQNGPAIADAIGNWLGGVIATIVPIMARATGMLIDWVAAALPQVLGAIARFIDSVVQGLVPLGGSSGVQGPLSDAGASLVSWIGERIGPAIDALSDWAAQVIGWLWTVLLPRVVVALLAIGAALVKALWDGMISVVTNPEKFVDALGKAMLFIGTAAVVLNAASIAGALVMAAFRAGMIAAGAAVNFFAAAVIPGITALGTEAAPAAAASGTALGTTMGLAMKVSLIAAGVAAAALIGIEIGKQANNALFGIDAMKSQMLRDATNWAPQASDIDLMNGLRSAQEGLAQAHAIDGANMAGVQDELKEVIRLIEVELAARKERARFIASQPKVTLESHRAHDQEQGPSLTPFGTPSIDIGGAFAQQVAAPIDEATKAQAEAFKTLNHEIQTNVKTLKDQLAGIKVEPFKSDATKAKEATRIIKEAKKLRAEALKVGDTDAVVRLDAVIADAKAKVAYYKKAADLYKTTIETKTPQPTAAEVALANEKKAALAAAAAFQTALELHRSREYANDTPSRGGGADPKTPPKVPVPLPADFSAAEQKWTDYGQRIKEGFATLPSAIQNPMQTAVSRASKVLDDYKPVAGTKAAAVVGAVRSAFASVSLFAGGARIIQSWIDGMLSKLPAVDHAGWTLAQELAYYTHGKSPPPRGPLSTIDDGGANIVEAWNQGMLSQLSAVNSTALRLAGAADPTQAIDPLGFGGRRESMLLNREPQQNFGNVRDNGETERLLRLAVAALGLNNELTAAGVKNRPRGVDKVGAKGFIAQAKVASGGRI